jgi:hypothetical protein
MDNSDSSPQYPDDGIIDFDFDSTQVETNQLDYKPDFQASQTFTTGISSESGPPISFQDPLEMQSNSEQYSSQGPDLIQSAPIEIPNFPSNIPVYIDENQNLVLFDASMEQDAGNPDADIDETDTRIVEVKDQADEIFQKEYEMLMETHFRDINESKETVIGNLTASQIEMLRVKPTIFAGIE